MVDMTIEHAEGIFAVMLKQERSPNRRADLRDSLVKHRALADARIDHALLHDRDARRRVALEERAHAAVHMGAGSAVGQAQPAEVLFGVPLPTCDRWGDVLAMQQGCPDDPVYGVETLGQQQRASLPHAALARERVGPHGTIDAQMRSGHRPVVSWHDMLRRTEDHLLGRAAMDYAAAAHAGVALESSELDDGEDDVEAEQDDGARVWPPRALRVDPDGVATLLERIALEVDEHMGVELPLGFGLKAELYWHACRTAAASAGASPKALRGFKALGVCATAKDRARMAALQQRTLDLAMAAFSQSSNALGTAAWKVAGAIAKCAAE
ncbi:MAG: hypothetical protein ACKVI4_15750 [Actinomycetales bacterium]